MRQSRPPRSWTSPVAGTGRGCASARDETRSSTATTAKIPPLVPKNHRLRYGACLQPCGDIGASFFQRSTTPRIKPTKLSAPEVIWLQAHADQLEPKWSHFEKPSEENDRNLLTTLERETGIEPATSSLGSWHSTAELLPLASVGLVILEQKPPREEDLKTSKDEKRLPDAATDRRQG